MVQKSPPVIRPLEQLNQVTQGGVILLLIWHYFGAFVILLGVVGTIVLAKRAEE